MIDKNVVGALDDPTSGKVLIDGKDIFSMPEKRLTVFRRRNIGFIFQSFNLIPELDVNGRLPGPGMPALAPWTGDVSVTAAAGLEPSVIDDIAELEGVKRVFGRMEYSGLSVSSDTESGTAALISYEENQFKWEEEELNEGNTESVWRGTGDVLVTYRDGMQWKAGDTVTLHTPLGEKQVRIVGILSSTNASRGAGSLGYIICSEQL